MNHQGTETRRGMWSGGKPRESWCGPHDVRSLAQKICTNLLNLRISFFRRLEVAAPWGKWGTFWTLGWLAVFGSVCAAEAQTPAQQATDETAALPGNVEKFVVKTRSELNPEVPFYVRVPAAYQPGAAPTQKHRVLFVCPPIHRSGLKTISSTELDSLTTEHPDWFVVVPTFRMEAKNVRDRKISYYYPETWSGRAVGEALAQIAKKYPIDTERLFLSGFSGGAQFVHRLAIWAPERVAAVCVNSSSWFDEPTEGSREVAWFVSVGEADPAYGESLAFVDQLRAIGAYPLFQEVKGGGHGRSGEATKMMRLFFGFYHELMKGELGKKRVRAIGNLDGPRVPLERDRMAMVGDSQDFKAYPNTPENVEMIPEDARVYLPTAEMAEVWARGDDL